MSCVCYQPFRLVVVLLVLSVNFAGCSSGESEPIVLDSYASASPNVAHGDPSKPTEDEFDDNGLRLVKPEEVETAPIEDILRTARTRFENSELDQLDVLIDAIRRHPLRITRGRYLLDQTYAVLGLPGKMESHHSVVLNRWVQSRPHSISPLLVIANMRIKELEEERGRGLAGLLAQAEEDGEENWRITSAKAALHQSLERDKSDPAIYAGLLQLAKFQNLPRDEAEALLEQSLQVNPNYRRSYLIMADYLTPPFSDTAEEVVEFAQATADKIGGDEGLEMYARIALVVHCYPRQNVFEQFDVEKLKASVPIIQAKVKETVPIVHFACLIACQNGDHRAANELFKVIGDDYWEPIWRSQVQYRHYKAWSDPRLARGEEEHLIQTHPLGATTVSFSPEGKILLTTGRGDLTVKLWEVASGKFLRGLPNIERGGSQAQFSHDGKYLVVSGAGHDNLAYVALWRFEEGNEPKLFEGHVGGVRALALSHDAQRLATASNYDRKLRIWSTKTQAEELLLEGIQATSLAFSHDGKLLWAIDGRDGLKRVKLDSGESEVVELPEEGLLLSKLVTLDSGEVKVLAQKKTPNGSVGILNLRDNTFTAFAEGAASRTPALTLTGDGRYALFARSPRKDEVGYDIVVWDVNQQREAHVFRGHWNTIADVAFSPDGKTLASAGADGTVRLWDFEQVRENPDKQPDTAATGG